MGIIQYRPAKADSPPAHQPEGPIQLRVAVYRSFDELPEGVRTLCSAEAQGRWFDSLDWFQCLFATALAESVLPRIYVVNDAAGNVVACLFCCVHRRGSRELASLSNYYTMEFGPIVKSGTDAKAACAVIVDHIASERPRWHTVRLDYLKESNRNTASLVDALALAGFAVHRHHQYENWYLECAGMSFDTYFAARPSRLKNTIERKGRKLHKTHQVKFVLYRHESDDISRGVQDYVAVYNSSWKRPEPHPDFIPDLARRLVAHDKLRLGVLYADGKPVAAQFWITASEEACIYKLAYDEKYADLSVGAALSRELFRQALDIDRPMRIDYGVGSEPYKREWMSAMQQIFGVRAYSRRTARGLKRDMTARLRSLAKHVVGRSSRTGSPAV